MVKILKSFAPDKFAKYGQAGDGDREGAFELGYAWEDVLAAALAKRPEGQHPIMEPVELARDGIFGTPDRILWDGQRFIDEELKVTWFSAAKIVHDPQAILSDSRFLYWVLQSKTYAAMLMQYRPWQASNDRGEYHWYAIPATPSQPGPAFAPITRIRALFVNGTYEFKHDNRARPLAWQIEWTAAELEAWWKTCLKHAEETQTNG